MRAASPRRACWTSGRRRAAGGAGSTGSPPPGAEALDAWRSEPTAELYEIRDAGLLKLFFGADPGRSPSASSRPTRRSCGWYEELRDAAADAPEGARLTIEAGIGHEREYVRFWKRVRDGAA